MKPITWGLIGVGPAATDIARAVAADSTARLGAVTSRDPDRAHKFVRRMGTARVHADVAALVDDPGVDVVYVSSPTSLHREHALLALSAGKAVVCEKPFTTSATDAEAVVSAAEQAGVFCMEAMWLRFNSVIRRMKTSIDSGDVGAPRAASIRIGRAKEISPLWRGEDARGALQTFGCYGVSLAVHLFGPVVSVTSTARSNVAGVDLDIALLLDHGRSTTVVDASIAAHRTNQLEVITDRAALTIPRSIIDPQQLVVRSFPFHGRRASLADVFVPVHARLPRVRAHSRSGFRGEVAEVGRCLRSGLLQSPIMPLNDTLHVQRVMGMALAAATAPRVHESEETA